MGKGSKKMRELKTNKRNQLLQSPGQQWETTVLTDNTRDHGRSRARKAPQEGRTEKGKEKGDAATERAIFIAKMRDFFFSRDRYGEKATKVEKEERNACFWLFY